MELKIYTPDDSGKYYTTNIEVSNKYYYSINDRISPNSFRNHHEPTIAAIKDWVNYALNLKQRGRSEKFSELITIGDEIKGLKLMMNKIHKIHNTYSDITMIKFYWLFFENTFV